LDQLTDDNKCELIAAFERIDCLNSGTGYRESRRFRNGIHKSYALNTTSDSFWIRNQSSVLSTGREAVALAAPAAEGPVSRDVREASVAGGTTGARPARTTPRPAALAA
jgi:hypothetical protein